MFKKFLSLFLCVAVLFSLLPSSTAFANIFDPMEEASVELVEEIIAHETQIGITSTSSRVFVSGRLAFDYRPHRFVCTGRSCSATGTTPATCNNTKPEPLRDSSITIRVVYTPIRTPSFPHFRGYVDFAAATTSTGFFSREIDIENIDGWAFREVRVFARAINDASYIVSRPELQGSDNAINVFFGTLPVATVGGVLSSQFTDLITPDSGAFSILKTLHECREFLFANGGTPPSGISNPVRVVWNQNCTNGSSYYSQADRYVSISYISEAHFLKSIIAHEYGHYLMSGNSRYYLPGGAHTAAQNQNESFTFSEGWATFFAQATLGDSVYLGRNSYDIESPAQIISFTTVLGPSTFDITTSNSSNQVIDAAVMWDIIDPYNPAEPWDRVTRPFSESWSNMLKAVDIVFPSNSFSATLQTFYDEYFKTLPENTMEAYNFWEVFYANGRITANHQRSRQFDNIPPEVRIVSVGLVDGTGNFRVRAHVRDNVMVQRVELWINGTRQTGHTIYNSTNNIGERYDGYVVFMVPVANLNPIPIHANKIEVRAFDHARGYTSAGTLRDGKLASGLGGMVSFSPDVDISNANVGNAAEIVGSASAGSTTMPRQEFGSATYSFILEGDATNNIAVVPGQYDNIGTILTSMDIPFDTITSADFANYAILSNYDIVFVNCDTQPHPTVARQFVQNGGILYVSDWSGLSLQQVFPGLRFTYVNAPQTIDTRIVDAGLATQLNNDNLQVTLNLPDWVLATQIPSDANVYVESTYLYINGRREPHRFPLAFSFRHGEGKVFFTSFHNNAQATGDMMQFLEYLIFNIQHSHNEDNLIDRAESTGYNYAGAVFATLDAGEKSQYFSLTPNQGHNFKIMPDSSMGDFSLTLVDPLGRVFNNAQSGAITHSEILSPQEIESNRVVATQKNIFTPPNVASSYAFERERHYELDVLEINSTEIITPLAVENNFLGFDDLEMNVVSLGSLGIIITDPIPGEWQFAVTSNNAVDNAAVAIGIAERPQAPLITNADEIFALQSGNGIIAQGIAPVAGQIHWLLVDDSSERVSANRVSVNAGDNFNIALPNLPNGSYTLLAQAETQSGLTGGIILVDILVNSEAPEIIVHERFERQIFDDTVFFSTAAINAAEMELYHNGESIGVSPVWSSDAASITVELNLAEGQNEVIIIAASATGLVSEKIIFITSDTTTPAELRPIPVITDISLPNHSEVKEPVTVTFRVENADLCDTVVTVRFGSRQEDVRYLGNDTFSFTFDPAKHVNSPDILRQIHIRAENRWRNIDDAYIGIFVFSPDRPILPDDTWCAETIYTGGEIVIYNGLKYQSRWWTQGDRPDGHNMANPWLFIGDEILPWRPDIGYRVGTLVNFNGRIYEALSFWINAGVVPGSDEFHWIFMGYTDGVAYRVTVNSIDADYIIGGGNYAAGEIVNIFAGIRPGYTFSHWIAAPTANFVNSNMHFTSFHMPPYAVTVTANWEAVVVNLGDVNGDGEIDEADVALLTRFLLASNRIAFRAANPEFIYENADVNNNGTVTTADLTQLRYSLGL
jgi:uncharacterized repeat protein (TIGR02543 family)